MKKILKIFANKFLKRIQSIVDSSLHETENRLKLNYKKGVIELKNQHSQEIQNLTKNYYNLIKKLNKTELLPRLEETGFKVYSQFEEDGLLLYIFTMVGVTNKKVIEICAADGKECMASNLIINHGWNGLLFDGDEQNIQTGKDFFKANPSTFLIPPKFVQAWITKENINELIFKNQFNGEIDLLSLDIDGNDYWILKAIIVCSPRVIICETHDIIPSELSLTMPYNPKFQYHDLPEDVKDYRSVSLLAMTKLCKEKGYRLIGSHKYGFNVIFMRNDVGVDFFPEVSIESVHNNPWTIYGQKDRWEKVKHLNWEEV